MLTHLSLFSGIGGIDLAAEWAGFKTICFVEKDKYCQKVLRKHWFNVPIIEDVHDVKGEQFKNITLISGGFPCQPFSKAGKQEGEKDYRYLWHEMFRVICETQPKWVVAENVVGILDMGIKRTISELENFGYETTIYCLPACAVNAPHRRDRIFIIAYTNNHEWNKTKNKIPYEEIKFQQAENDFKDRGDRHSRFKQIYYSPWRNHWNTIRIATRLCGMDDGIPDRMDRIKRLGNAVVPQQIYPILKGIADIEMSIE